MARFGLSAKGVVYCLLGFIAFRAAFELGGQSSREATQSGAIKQIKDWPAGLVVLGVLALGLVCYSLWRFVEALGPDGREKRKWPKRVAYLFSGLGYLAIALTAYQLMNNEYREGGDSKQQWAARIMQLDFGDWLLGAGALLIAGIGIYQIYYGLSEKYRKHVQGMSQDTTSRILLRSGKIGYVARGLVWIIIGWLLFNAARHHNASEAGDTSKAFNFIESASQGSLILGAIGVGLAAYGVFSFIRAIYGRFN